MMKYCIEFITRLVVNQDKNDSKAKTVGPPLFPLQT